MMSNDRLTSELAAEQNTGGVSQPESALITNHLQKIARGWSLKFSGIAAYPIRTPADPNPT